MSEVHGIFVGLTTFDLIHYVEAFPEADEKIQASARWHGAGGPAANAAIAFSALGGRAELVTALGDGLFGSAARSELEEQLVSVENLARKGDVATSAVTVDRDGHRSVVSVNASGFDPREIARAGSGLNLTPPDVVVFDSHYPELTETIVGQLPTSTLAVFDPGNAKARAAGLPSLATHVIASRGFRVDCDASEILDMLGSTARLVAVTQGGDEIRVREGDNEYAIPVPTVEVVDTLGAGDVLHGSLAFHLSQGGDARAALHAAAADSARSCGRRGPRL
jgi:sugar/nucleoside kinase (ribokinase family)